MAGAAGPLSGISVLLVEDVADTREVLQRLLEADGAEVWCAGTAREAASIAAERSFDVLLTDLGLPDIPGDALIRTIVSQDSRRRPRVIAMTGFGEAFASRARRAGAAAVLVKPVPWEILVGHLAHVKEPAKSPEIAA